MTPRYLSLAALLLALQGCSGISTSFDYDTEADFSKFRSYSWQRAGQDEIDELTMRRARDAVDRGLGAKGYQRVDENPDFQVYVHFTAQDKVQVTDWGYGYGTRGRYYGGARQVDVHNYTEGSMILDFVNAATNELLWRGVASATVNPKSTPEERTERLNNAVDLLLADYPPG